MNNELERVWKEAVVFKFKALSRQLPRETEKTTTSSWAVSGSRLELRTPEYEAEVITT
jgi:hypothetical protein